MSLIILGLGVWTAIFTARTVRLSFSPVMFSDQWGFIDELKRADGTVSLPLLWAQHNEHRIPVGRIAMLADLRFFGGRNVSLLIEIYLVQLAFALLFIWMVGYFGKFRGVLLVTAAGLFSYCMFCPLQIENFYWGFQIAFVFAGFAAAVSFASLLWHAQMVSHAKRASEDTRTGWITWPLGLAFAAGFLSECSLADGLMVWPILLWLGVSLRFPKRALALIAGTGFIAIELYFLGYHSPTEHAKPWITIRYPFAIAKYVATFLGSTLDSSLPSPSSWPTVSESIAVLAIGFVLGYAIRSLLIRPAAPNLLRLFLGANLLFTALAAVLAGLGRLNFGMREATSSRYQSITLVFWASLAAFILTSISKEHYRSLALVASQLALVILMAAIAGQFHSMAGRAKDHQASLANAYRTLIYDAPNLAALNQLFPQPEFLPALYGYLRSHNLGPDAWEFSHGSPRLLQTSPNWGGYQLVSTDKCSGFLDGVERIKGTDRVAARGWAWDQTRRRAPQLVLLALPGGLIVGFGEVGAPRTDIPAARKDISDLRTGWDGEATAAHGSKLRAFAVLADSKSICPLANEKEAP